MTKGVVVLLKPQQASEEVIAGRHLFAKSGYQLAGMVDPTQKETVAIKGGLYVANSIPMAAMVCRTDTFLYCDTILHTNALEVSKWPKSKH